MATQKSSVSKKRFSENDRGRGQEHGQVDPSWRYLSYVLADNPWTRARATGVSFDPVTRGVCDEACDKQSLDLVMG